jgi:SAM-dependent methyltransferase
VVHCEELEICGAPCENCALCGGPSQLLYQGLVDHLFGAAGIWNLRKCHTRGCGLIWLDPMPLEEELAKAYQCYYTHVDAPIRQVSSFRGLFRDLGEGYLVWRYGYRNKALPRWYVALGWIMYFHPGARANLDFSVFYLRSNPTGRLLEIGIGSGEMLASLRERGWQVQGVDTDPDAVNNAQAKGLTVHLGTLEQQSFPESSFDGIVMSHVIEHIPSPTELLRECHRLLKPGGTLALVTPNATSWGHRLYQRNWRGLEPPRHCYIFTPGALRVLAARAGFQQLKIWTTIRDANGMFLASERIRAMAAKQVPSDPPSRRAYRRARLMQLLEWALLKVKPDCGEEIVLMAGR